MNIDDTRRQSILYEAQLIVEGCTIRECAKLIGNARSNVHYDMTVVLPKISEKLADKVKERFEENKIVGRQTGGIIKAKQNATKNRSDT